MQVDKLMVQRMYATFLRANRYLNALLLLNSLCDPIIYAFRLRDVQLGYRKLFQKCVFYRQKRHNSFRSSMMRQTQVVHLPAMDNINAAHSNNDNGGGGPSPDPPCNNLALCCDDLLVADDLVAEVTPMVVCSAQGEAGANGAVCHRHHHHHHHHHRHDDDCDPAAVRKGKSGNGGGGGGGCSGEKFPNSLCSACNVGSSCSLEKVSQV